MSGCVCIRARIYVTLLCKQEWLVGEVTDVAVVLSGQQRYSRTVISVTALILSNGNVAPFVGPYMLNATLLNFLYFMFFMDWKPSLSGSKVVRKGLYFGRHAYVMVL